MEDVRGHGEAAEGEGMSETGFAIYGLLIGAQAGHVANSSTDDTHERAREIAAGIEDAVEPHINIVDWSHKTDVQREMRRKIKRQLPDELYGKPEQERIAAAMIDLLRVRKGR